MNPLSSAALILAGHGSTQNAESSLPTRSHAEEIRRRGIFSEVNVAFWLEEPFFKNILSEISSSEIYLVPNFICEGFYTREILPREFGLEGAVTQKEGRSLYYCDPVGLHSSMTDLLVQRALTILKKDAVNLASTCLLVAGHGTPKNKNSTHEVYKQVELIRARNIFAQVEAVFMEEAPLIQGWSDRISWPHVVCVPFFIADGLHPAEDIPVMLGITQNAKRDGFTNPTHFGSQRLWYSSSIGTEPGMVEIILAQVDQFRLKLSS